MRRYLCIAAGAVIVVLVGMVVFGSLYLPKQRWEVFWAKKHKASFELYGFYEVDTNKIRDNERVKEGEPFTLFFQNSSYSSQQSMYSFVVPDIGFDFENHYMLVTFGRELKEVRYKDLGNPYMEEVEVTFGGKYFGDVMFVYSMDKMQLDDFYAKYYIMRGPIRMFWTDGVGGLNEKIPSGQQQGV